MIGTLIRSQPRATLHQALAWLAENNPERLDQAKLYTQTLWSLAPQFGYDPTVLLGQAAVETGDPRTGDAFQSHLWVADLNPAGIGMTDSGKQDYRAFADGEDAAIAHLVHMIGYVEGAAGIRLPLVVSADPRWTALVRSGMMGTVESVEDLGSGRWATQDSSIYSANILANMAGIIGSAEEVHMAEQFRGILSMGHHNDNRGGAAGEFDRVDDHARAVKAEIRRRGGLAWIVQEEDGDGNPNDFTAGGLQSAAMKCVDLASKYGPFDVYLSFHHDSSPGYHAIFPDSPRGGIDVKANNPLDLKVARALRDAVKATGTVGMKSWTLDSPGVMSEKETRVGEQGSRLGEFVGTFGFRQRTVRIITEASGNGDPWLTRAGWVDTYAKAIVDGLEEVFGPMDGIGRPDAPDVPTPGPEPEKRWPDPVRIPELASLPAYVKLDNGAQLIRADYMVRAVRDTPRLMYADPDSERVGEDVKAGQTFGVDYLIITETGGLYFYSDYATRFKFEDLEVYLPDVDDTPDIVDG